MKAKSILKIAKKARETNQKNINEYYNRVCSLIRVTARQGYLAADVGGHDHNSSITKAAAQKLKDNGYTVTVDRITDSIKIDWSKE